MPPVFGPEMRSVRSGRVERQVERNDRNSLRNQAADAGRQVSGIRPAAAAELDRAAAEASRRISRERKVNRARASPRATCDELRRAVDVSFGELGKNPVDLSQLFRLELANSVSRFDCRGRLDEKCSSLCSRCRARFRQRPSATFAANRNDEASVANAHRHVGNLKSRLEPCDDSLEHAHDLALRTAHLATHAAQRRRRFIAHVALVVDRSLEAFSSRGAINSASTSARISATATAGIWSPLKLSAVSREDRRKLRTASRSSADSARAFHAKSGKRRRDVEQSAAGCHARFAVDEASHCRDARVLALDPVAIGCAAATRERDLRPATTTRNPRRDRAPRRTRGPRVRVRS